MIYIHIDTYDMEYDGEKFEVKLYYVDGKRKIEFNYKGNEIFWFFEDRYDVNNIANNICRIIDTIGIEGFEKYKKYKENISLMRFNYIIVGNNVYKPYMETISSGNLKYHIMMIGMADNTTLDGSSPYKIPHYNIEDRDEYSKTKTLQNLKDKAIKYYESNNILPSDKYLVEGKTKQYQEIQQWFKDNKISSID